MMRYILICEATKHAKEIDRDRAVRLLKPFWSDIEKTMAILDAADDEEHTHGKHFAVPIQGPMGRYTIHIAGRMDLPGAQSKLTWVDPEHVCSPACMSTPYERVVQTHFGYRRNL